MSELVFFYTLGITSPGRVSAMATPLVALLALLLVAAPMGLSRIFVRMRLKKFRRRPPYTVFILVTILDQIVYLIN